MDLDNETREENRKCYDMLVRWHNKYVRSYDEILDHIDGILNHYEELKASGRGTPFGKARTKGRLIALRRLRNRYVEHHNRRVNIINRMGLVVHGSYIYKDKQPVGHISNWIYVIRKFSGIDKYRQLKLF